MSPPETVRRSPLLNAMVVAAIVVGFVIAGVVIWTSWSRDSVTAVDEAHEAVVQPLPSQTANGAAAPAG